MLKTTNKEALNRPLDEAEVERLRAEILALVEQRNHVSFAELSRLEGFRGDFAWLAMAGLVLWADISAEAVEAIHQLCVAGSIEGKSTTPLVYFCDGGAIDLPIATKAQAYKKDHWLPLVFNLPGGGDALANSSTNLFVYSRRDKTPSL